MLIVITPYFILLVLKQVNVVAIVIVLIIHMQEFPDVVKNLKVKVSNLMSGINETRDIEWDETCNVD